MHGDELEFASAVQGRDRVSQPLNGVDDNIDANMVPYQVCSPVAISSNMLDIQLPSALGREPS